MEEIVGESFDPAAPEPEDGEFDFAYGKELGGQAMDLLKGRSTGDAGLFRWRALCLHIGEGLTVAQAAEKLGRSEREVKTDLQTGLRQFREILKDLIRQTCATEESLDEEQRRLLKILEGWG